MMGWGIRLRPVELARSIRLMALVMPKLGDHEEDRSLNYGMASIIDASSLIRLPIMQEAWSRRRRSVGAHLQAFSVFPASKDVMLSEKMLRWYLIEGL